MLFASFQFQTAAFLGLSPLLMVTLQVVGGPIGNMVCVNNVVAVCATAGIANAEGLLIRRNALPCAVYAACAAALVTVLIYAGADPIAYGPP